MSTISPLRRVITGFNSDGKSIFVADGSPTPLFFHTKSASSSYNICKTESTPVKLDEDTSDPSWIKSQDTFPKFCPKDGASARSFDYAPHSESPAHRTDTVDFAIVTHGSIELYLDDGEKCVLKAGDTLVQRGTQHKWVNSTDEWARVVFVSVQAEAPVFNGEVMQDTMQDKFNLAPKESSSL